MRLRRHYSRAVLALGQVVGALLDRHASIESGSARLVVHERGEEPSEHELYWRSADVWRVEGPRYRVVCDGIHVYEKPRRGPAERPRTARLGHPAWELQLVFPLRAHVWGRMGDDYFMAAAAPEGDTLVRVGLLGTEDDRTGSLLVDMATGCVREADYSGTRLRLVDLDLRPQPDGLFVAPDHE